MIVSSSRFGALVAISGLCALVAGCSSGSPEAVVQDNTPGKLLSGEAFMTGLGLESPNSSRERPDNRPRAQLVIPPNRSLPSPDEQASATNAAWPNDPDVARANRQAALRNRDDDRKGLGRDDPLGGATVGRGENNVPISRRKRDPLGERFRNSDRQGEGPALRPDELRREAGVARAIRAREVKDRSPAGRLIEPPKEYLERPEGAPPPEKKKRKWWPF